MASFGRLVTYLLVLSTLSGCLVTPLKTPQLPRNLYRLQALNQRQIQLLVSPIKDTTLGRQYLMFFIPFGRITDQSPAKSLYDLAFQELAVRGYKTVSSDTSPTRSLSISIGTISLNAYDFLFFRRIVARVELTLQLNGRKLEFVNATKSKLTQSAFAPELSALYHQSLSEALAKGFNALGLESDKMVRK